MVQHRGHRFYSWLGTKIPHATWCNQEVKKKKIKKTTLMEHFLCARHCSKGFSNGNTFNKKKKETGSQRQGQVQTHTSFDTLRDFSTAPKPPHSHPTKSMESGQEKPLTSVSQTVPCKILETPICPFTYIVNSIHGVPTVCSIMNKSRFEPRPTPRLSPRLTDIPEAVSKVRCDPSRKGYFLYTHHQLPWTISILILQEPIFLQESNIFILA